MDFLQSEEMYQRIKQHFSLKFISQKVTKAQAKQKAKPQKETQDLTQHIDINSMSLEDAIKYKRDYEKSFPSTYDPQFVESRWNEWWKSNKFYQVTSQELEKVGREDRYVMVLPPPNVTGKLHIGHALMNSIEDFIIRHKRMQGKHCVYIPGLDHAGIATQCVVEKKLAQQGIYKRDLSREDFVGHIWKWKEEYGKEIMNQFTRMGCSFDYSREFFTMDEPRSKSVLETFCQLYDRGLIYRANRLVNWSCALNTAISNIEVDTVDIKPFQKMKVPGYDKEVEFGVMVDFAYKVKGSDQEIIVSTTRIETMLGDVAVAVNSKDPRYQSIVGKELEHPFIKDRKMVVITDDELVDMSFGTGAVKITPAHDPNDFQCAKRNNLSYINILNSDGTINENGGQFRGMPRYLVREKIIEELQKLNLFKGKKKNPMTLQVCSKSGDIIEPKLVPQWYVKCEEISKRLIQVVDDGEMILVPNNHVKVWKNFMNNSEDWCISRQLYWGHRIPAYKAKLENDEFLKENDEDKWFVGRNIEEVKNQVRKLTSQNFELVQDEDVLDTWFSSALLPFSAAGWPDLDHPDFKLLFPNDVLETGYDILFFWVAKMAMMSLFLFDKVPFKKVILHNIVRSENGEKMSKSKGNVVDPLEIIDGCELSSLIQKIKDSVLSDKEKVSGIKDKEQKYPKGIPRCGSDALRFSLLSYVKENKDVNLDIQIPIRDRNFCNKIWNSYKFVRQLLPDGFHPQNLDQIDLEYSESDKWLLNAYAKTIQIVEQSIEDHKYGQAAEEMQQFWIHIFCDFYIEYSKSISEASPVYNTNRCCLFYVLESFLRLLHPIMPFLTEELYQKLIPFEGKQQTISLAKYPVVIERHLNMSSNFEEVILELIKKIRKQLSGITLLKDKKPSLFISKESSLINMIIEYNQFIIEQCKIQSIEITEISLIPNEGLKSTIGDISYMIQLKGVCDVQKESQKIKTQIQKTKPLHEKLEKKIGHPGYSTSVPSEVQEVERNQLMKYEQELIDLEQSLQTLQNLSQQQYLKDTFIMKNDNQYQAGLKTPKASF